MGSFRLLQLILFIYTLILEIEVAQTQQQAIGCPLFFLKTSCYGRFVDGQLSNFGTFIKIGSIIELWNASNYDSYVILRCQEDGTYNGTTPCHLISQNNSCDAYIYQSINYLTMHPSQSTFLVGRVLSFSCEPGFTLEGPESVYCRSYYKWSDKAIPRCRGCPYPGHLVNGYYTDSKGLPFNDGDKAVNEILTAHCDQGFMLLGNHFIACKLLVYWPITAPKCVDASCQPPNIKSNGKYVFPNGSDTSSYKFRIGQKLLLMCKKGYYSSSDKNYITCNVRGIRSIGIDFGCKLIKCEKPKHIENGSYLVVSNSGNHSYAGNPVPYGTSIYVSCQEGFFKAGNTMLECTETGTWSGEKPNCTQIICKIPHSIANGGYQLNQSRISALTTFTYKEKVFVHCNKGYELRTDPYRTCIMANVWSGETPICEKIVCPKPISALNLTYLDEKGIVRTQSRIVYNAKIFFQCQIGYNLTVGTATRMCTATGNLTGINSLCVPVACTKPEVTSCGHFMQSNTTQILWEREFSYNSTLLFVCNLLKYSCQNKTRENMCSEGGPWIENIPICGKYKHDYSFFALDILMKCFT
ncbi:sushi, von Willebrand factor type A, EGF and pentraxin domain-containing protein 1-like [Ruditapes philippinarum]|uniref:sushi, von Willebrand factor type A, EGF and pentraxin domain-containing protein 1-like n=1 Tax=Ruditapes philippinarum TaxID=129788 RepID=UPI00295ABB76|nr:sushi, von Willebrand factor type A, EGF and pentraxin domain-containing protein 1-like [Ruditapes philippinarum]